MKSGKYDLPPRAWTCLIAVAALGISQPSLATLIGPSGGSGASGEYSSFADSPFAGISFANGYFYLEDFEDGLLNTPGVSASSGGITSQIFGPSLHDSVDGDDGVIDGSGLNGDSYFSAFEAGVTWMFDALVLGDLPTHAGIVWTDGIELVRFDAFDAAGAPIGAPVVGFHENGSFAGQTSDDRFYGVVYEQGISAIQIRSLATAGMELDHLQYGRADIQAPPPPPVGTVSAPHSAALLALGLSAFGVLRIKPRIRKRV